MNDYVQYLTNIAEDSTYPPHVRNCIRMVLADNKHLTELVTDLQALLEIKENLKGDLPSLWVQTNG